MPLSGSARPERRKQRSAAFEIALERWLAAAAARRGIDAIVLCCGDGRSVGIGPAGVDLHRLALAGRATARGLEPDDLDDVTGGRDLYAHAWSDGARSWTLVTLGVRVSCLKDVAAGIHRIADETF